MCDAPLLQTKFGTARVRNDGYYIISSKKEGNYNKLLHRLIIEDFYNVKLPKGWVVHHEDNNKLNNEIWNLIPMPLSDHSILHNTGKNNGMYGKTHSDEVKRELSKRCKGVPLTEEHKKKISLGVRGKKHPLYGKHHTEESKRKMSESHKGKIISMETRRKISLAISGENHGLYGKHHTEESKRKMSESHKGKILSESHIKNLNIAKSNTGIYHLIIKYNPRYTQGYTFAYKYNDKNGKICVFSNVDIIKLKEKVIAQGFHWEILDETKAKKFIESVGLKLEDIK